MRFLGCQADMYLAVTVTMPPPKVRRNQYAKQPPRALMLPHYTGSGGEVKPKVFKTAEKHAHPSAIRTQMKRRLEKIVTWSLQMNGESTRPRRAVDAQQERNG